MKRLQGFSLIELAVVLTVVGASAFLFMALVSGGSGPTDSSASRSGDRGAAGGSSGSATRYVDDAQSQLLGFLRSQNRLPCPDTDGDGLENCGDTGSPNSRGVLPYRTMGLSQPVLNASQFPLVYGVYRRPRANSRDDMDLARLINRFDPLLPNGQLTQRLNSLDFCHALRNAAAAPHSSQHLMVDADAPLNQAYVLVDPGAGDADGQGAVLDGVNVVGTGFESPGRARTEAYDDIVLSMGFNQLSARLACPASMARVNAAARGTMVASDIAELTDFFRDFRRFARDVAVDELILASVGVATTAAGGGFTLVDAAISINQGINSGTAATVAAAIPIGVSLGLLAFAVVEAAVGVASAEETRVLNQSLYDAAIEADTQAQSRLQQKLLELHLEEERARLR